MENSVLDESVKKNIIFDVLDGIPPSKDESEQAAEFRKEIEINNRNLVFRAEELGFGNVLFEFSSQG